MKDYINKFGSESDLSSDSDELSISTFGDDSDTRHAESTKEKDSKPLLSMRKSLISSMKNYLRKQKLRTISKQMMNAFDDKKEENKETITAKVFTKIMKCMKPIVKIRWKHVTAKVQNEVDFENDELLI
jgi:hypothetical protein